MTKRKSPAEEAKGIVVASMPVSGYEILILEANPFHPSLRLHALQGKLAGLHSVSINLSYRITIEFLIQGRQIIPIHIGDHDAVYY
jgi:mRNA-degrading endonuclease YafQ of YafQ-DinJ toxin-antitoxin module